jgi:signal transduction histidine kinase
MKTLPDQLNVLVIEDNPTDLFLIEEMLGSSSLQLKNVYSCDRSSEACTILRQHDIDLVFLDLSLPDSFGIESFLNIKEATQKIPVIILTGMSDSEVALQTLKQGAQDYLVKGEFNIGLLTKSVEYSIERKKAEERILTAEEKYRQQITDAVLRAQEKERKAIGQELHDNINQILAAAKLYFDESMLQEEHRVEFSQLGMKNISLAIEEIRKLSRALIIPGFIKSGLSQSLHELIRHIQLAKKICITLDLDKFDEKNISESIKINLYRIIQEQLNNILKYAEASTVTIRIHNSGDNIMLSVSDNGKGFDVNAGRNGVGITNINSRAGLFNGKVEIDSSPGNGCRLNVLLKTNSMLPQQAA